MSADENLFDVHVLDNDEANVVLISENFESDFALAYFGEWLEDVDTVLDPENEESILGEVVAYLSEILPEEDLEDVSITRAIFVGGSTVIITVSLGEDAQEYIDSTYNTGDDVEAQLFGESEDDEEDDECCDQNNDEGKQVNVQLGSKTFQDIDRPFVTFRT